MIDAIQKKFPNLRTLIITILLYILCYSLIIKTLMFWDVSWHIEGAKRMLHGGTYLSNLFDDNPPAVFAFYIPFVALNKLIAMPSYQLAFLYILAVFAISNYVTLRILKNSLTNNYTIHTLYFSSIMVILFFGITIIGQRENIIVCLSIPYIFMNLLNKHSNSKSLQTITALLATIGFSQIPFFILIPLSLDIIDCIANKRKPQVYQTLFYLFFITSIVLSYLLYPNYYQFLLKLLYHFQKGIDSSYTSLLKNIFFTLTFYTILIVTLFALFFYRRTIYTKLIAILLVTLLIYVLEEKAWFYHIYPIVCYTFLAFVFIHLDNKFTEHKQYSHRILKHVLLILFAFLLLILTATIFSYYLENYRAYNLKNSVVNKLIIFSKSTDPKDNKTLFISTRVFPAYLLTLYGNLNVVSPWANCWMLPSLINYKHQPKKIKQYNVGKRLFFKLTYTTLNKQQPKYIIYYQPAHTLYIKQKNFDVLKYLKQNKTVANEFKRYKFDRKIGSYHILIKKTEKK